MVKETINIPVDIFDFWARYGMTKDEEKVFKAILGMDNIQESIYTTLDKTADAGKSSELVRIVKYTQLKQDKVENASATLQIKNVIIWSDSDGCYMVNQPRMWSGYKSKSKDKAVTEKPISSDVQEIFNYWNSKDIIAHRKLTRGPSGIEGHSVSALKTDSVADIKKAIDNYGNILKNDRYFWTHIYKLPRFLERGIENFFDKAKPYEQYVSKEYKQQERIRLTEVNEESKRIDVDKIVRRENAGKQT